MQCMFRNLAHFIPFFEDLQVDRACTESENMKYSS